MTRIPERLPAPLSERISSAAQSIYSRQGKEVDVAIAGIPFRLATIPELPQSVETVPARKDQFDTELDPGEQSLSTWWRRSQSSFHEGAGNLYQESSESNTASNGFFDSEGVDVFTPGRFTLLGAMGNFAPAAAVNFSRIRTFFDGSLGFSAIESGDLHTCTDGTNFAALHSPGDLADGLVANDYFYDVSTTGTLYEGTVASPGTATTWPLVAGAAGGTVTPSRLMWGKHRLWVIGLRKIWQPDLSTAGGTNQDPIFTHPNQGWVYTSMAEGPAAMYFAGHDGLTSSIQAITLDSGGGLPTLSGAAVSAILPDGELVHEIAVLAGQLIGIGTSRGFRVGEIQANGAIQYGPLLIEPEGVTACTAVTAQGRFFVVAFNSTANEVYRVDTGTVLSEGVYPYAKDITCDGDNVTSLAASGSYVYATTDDGLAWKQGDEKVPTGYLQTGRIRFRTNEPKNYRFVSFESEPLAGGAVAVQLIKEGGSTLDLGTFNTAGSIFDDNFAIDQDPMRYASLKFTLTSDGEDAPVLNSYLLRALPATTPARMITLPLLCFDHEQARSGTRYGGSGFARDRLTALQLIEDDSTFVVFQDFTDTDVAGQIVTIESMRYVQTNIGGAHRVEGSGGILYVQLRTVVA